MNKALLCNAMLVLLARYRVPQVVLLTEQTNPRENGVYEVVLGSEHRGHVLVRVGDPSTNGRVVVGLGPGRRVADFPDEHGFFPIEEAPRNAVHEWLLSDEPAAMRLRAAIIGSAEGQAAIHPVST